MKADLDAYVLNVSGDKAQLTQTIGEHIRSIHDLERVCDIDLDVWEVKHFTCETHTKDAMAGAQQTFKVKAWLEQRTQLITARQEIDSLLADAKLRNTRKPLVHRYNGGDNMLEAGIYDAHFGKLAWALETGHTNYDLRIAQDDFSEALETIIDRTRSFKFDQVVFPLGNDILNSDSSANLTTRGTPQDTDGRFQKSFKIVRQLAVQAINRLSDIAPVIVPLISGNHDELSVWHLGDSLECWFDGDDNVTIMNDPTTRKYLQYGDVMLMWCHGDKGKRSTYPSLMATEEPAMWGATKYREIHVGHTHTTKVDEYHGVQIRTLRALCPPDAWHAERGFVGNLRGAEGFVWNREEGLISQAYYTVGDCEAVAA